jgi:hypothetical protein
MTYLYLIIGFIAYFAIMRLILCVFNYSNHRENH